MLMARDLFATLDLNLLKTLSILAQEQNMRRAAERLFVTQPAVSQALKKLRHHFGDELFVKTPSGLQPTSFTTGLMDRVEPVLDSLSAALNEGESFDPAAIDRHIRVVLAPHLVQFLSARLFRSIHGDAPDVELGLDTWSANSLADLVKGEYLLGVSLPIENVPAEVDTLQLADDYFTIYVREGHPRFGGRDSLELKELDGVEVAALTIPGFNVRVAEIERAMKSNKLQARVRFRSAEPSAVTDVVRATDMVYGASSYIGQDALAGLRALNIRVNDRLLNRPVTAYFHRKNRNSPLLGWLLQQVSSLLEK